MSSSSQAQAPAPPRRVRFSFFPSMNFHSPASDSPTLPRDVPHTTPRHPAFRLFRDVVDDDVHSTPIQSESPLRRAGLLQPISNASSYPTRQIVTPHSQDTIRLNTVQLSNMLMAPPVHAETVSVSPQGPSVTDERTAFIFPLAEQTSLVPDDLASDAHIPISCQSSFQSFDLTASTTSSTPSVTQHPIGNLTPIFLQMSPFRPSGLSLLLARRPERESQSHEEPTSSSSLLIPTGPAGPVDPYIPHHDHIPEQDGHQNPDLTSTVLPPSLSDSSHDHISSPKKAFDEWPPASSTQITAHESTSDLTETAPLLDHDYLASYHPSYTQNGGAHRYQASCSKADNDIGKQKIHHSTIATVRNVSAHVKEIFRPKSLENVLIVSIKSLPAVMLGSLLNILDGVSYGMIIFPTIEVFAGLGPMGVSIFFVSTLIAQLVYTFGGSGFAGANGSMMIEVVPFFHILATSIAQQIGEDKPREVIATTLVAYVLSSVLTGLTFFLLGALKLGVIIGFFPRHILVGCIGGVGAFLIETGFTVSLRIDDDDFNMSWETFKLVFLNSHNLALWVIPLGLAILLRIITHRYHHQLVFPLYFIFIPTVFYIVVAAASLDLASLRANGWIFDTGSAGQEPWYKFYSYFDFGAVRWEPLWSTLPTQFALLFFNILHPPLNVPALAVSLNEDVDTDKELVAHGYSNLLSAVCGTVPNYLVYVNTLLFYRVGGGTRIAGFLLAMATVLLLYIGTGPIAFLPVMVVSALIFVLGIDLVKEALWDTRHRVSRTEYITILSIIVAMTWWDFVSGVLFGIVVSCFFFVIQNSQRESIRALHTGETAMSTVRRPGIQRAYLREVSKQTTILRLQGFLFFGTIAFVEQTIREALEGLSWQRNPIRFLVLDLSLVAGVDMSSAEAFVRLHRLLVAKYITLVFCGFSANSATGQALHSVGVLAAERVELFSTFGDAMEWTENAYLRAWFRSQKAEVSSMVALPGRQDADIIFQRSLASSPRRSHLDDAGKRTIAHEARPHLEPEPGAEPYNTLAKTFSSYGQLNWEQFQRLGPYFTRISAPEGTVMWKQNDPSDGLYIVESGILRAMYKFSDHTLSIEESMVPGTLAGELSALSSLPRNATVTVEQTAVLWKLTIRSLRQLEVDDPSLACAFTQVLLKATKIDYDILMSALATRQ